MNVRSRLPQPICSLLTALALLAALQTSSFGTIRNVPAQYPDIQTAINACVNGDTVVVGPGVYSITTPLDPSGKAITIKSQGGYGSCTLDGGGSSRLFYIHSGETGTTVINGFTLQHGATSGDGGAVYIASSSPKINNCLLQYNTASSGHAGAIFSNASSVSCASDTFYKNTVNAGQGGAMWSQGGTPNISGCAFVSNAVVNGSAGGLMLNATVKAKVSSCTFTNNSATNVGGGMVIVVDSASVKGCLFSGNSAAASGGLLITGSPSPTISACTFTNNTGSYQAGGVSCYATKASFTNCVFNANTAGSGSGGGVYLDNSTTTLATVATFKACDFDSNSTSGNGGGLYVASSNATSAPSLTDCVFYTNSAGGDGGGALINGNPTFSACEFDHNAATANGGGLETIAGKPVLVNCLLTFNTAGSRGGALRFNGSSTLAHVTNCSFYGNAGNTTDGLYADASCTVTVNNSVVYDSNDSSTGFEINTDGTVALMVAYSDIYGGFGGTGNISSNPQYANASGGDLYLQNTSPCIDAASSAAPDFPKTDIDGVSRDRVAPDMGAYENTSS